MLTDDQITIVTPRTAEEVYAIAGDILTVAEAFGSQNTDSQQDDFIHWLATVPHIITIAYVDGQPAGWIRIDDPVANPWEVGRKCLEFSGVVLPEYQGSGLTEKVSPLAIAQAFARNPKAKKIVAVLPKGSPQAVAALNILGFEFSDETDDGKNVYKIKRDQFFATAS